MLRDIFYSNRMEASNKLRELKLKHKVSKFIISLLNSYLS
jgi:hypothetical protein